MATDEAEQLAEAENVPLYRAEKAIELQDGDYESAQRKIREAPVALKGRFATQDDELYGLFLIVLNSSPPSLESINGLVGNVTEIVNVQLSQTYSELNHEINRVIQNKGKMTELSRRLIEGLRQEFSPPSNQWIQAIEERDELTLQNELNNRISDFIEEEEILMTLSLETGLVEEEETETDSSPSQPPNKATTGADHDEADLTCDVRVSPVQGKPVKQLSPGDTIYVSINDKSASEHRNLVDIMERLKDDEVDLIPAPIVNIVRTQTGKLEFTVKFGENVRGRVLVGEDMNILTPRSASARGGGSLDRILPWLLLFLCLMGIGLSILYAVIL